MTRKKDIPLAVLEAIEPFLTKSNLKFEVADPQTSLLRIIDSEPDSPFYFKILGYDIQRGRTLLKLEYKPRNKLNVNAYSPVVEIQQLDG